MFRKRNRDGVSTGTWRVSCKCKGIYIVVSSQGQANKMKIIHDNSRHNGANTATVEEVIV